MTLLLGLLLQTPQEDLQQLKKENIRLKSQVRELQKQLETAERNGFYWPGAKSVGSPLSLLKKLPRELELKRKVFWGKHMLERVNEELRQSNGMPFAARVRIQSLSIREGRSEGIYDVQLKLSPQTFSHKGHNFQTHLHHPALSFRFQCDKEMADQLGKVDRNRSVPLSAQISNIDLRAPAFGSPSKVTMTLKGLSLDSIEIPK